MRNLIAFVLIAGLLCLGIFMILPGSPFLTGNDPEAARATAQADYLARSTPLTGEEYLAVHGMDTVADVAGKGFDANVRIAVSADQSQTALGSYICAAAWAFPVGVGIVGLVILIISFSSKSHKETNNRKSQTSDEWINREW